MLTVKITTAHKLSSAQLSKIKKAVETKYGKDVAYVEELNPEVVGGIRLLVGSKEIDATVSGKINRLKKQLESEL